MTPATKTRSRKQTPSPEVVASKEAARKANSEGDAISRVANKEFTDEESARLQRSAEVLSGPPPEPAKPKAKPAKAKKPSFRSEAEVALRASDGPMHVKDITEIVLKKVKTKGKTPAATLAKLMIDHDAFVRVAPGTYDLAELNPKGAKKRPAVTS